MMNMARQTAQNDPGKEQTEQKEPTSPVNQDYHGA